MMSVVVMTHVFHEYEQDRTHEHDKVVFRVTCWSLERPASLRLLPLLHME